MTLMETLEEINAEGMNLLLPKIQELKELCGAVADVEERWSEIFPIKKLDVVIGSRSSDEETKDLAQNSRDEHKRVEAGFSFLREFLDFRVRDLEKDVEAFRRSSAKRIGANLSPKRERGELYAAQSVHKEAAVVAIKLKELLELHDETRDSLRGVHGVIETTNPAVKTRIRISFDKIQPLMDEAYAELEDSLDIAQAVSDESLEEVRRLEKDPPPTQK